MLTTSYSSSERRRLLWKDNVTLRRGHTPTHKTLPLCAPLTSPLTYIERSGSYFAAKLDANLASATQLWPTFPCLDFVLGDESPQVDCVQPSVEKRGKRTTHMRFVSVAVDISTSSLNLRWNRAESQPDILSFLSIIIACNHSGGGVEPLRCYNNTGSQRSKALTARLLSHVRSRPLDLSPALQPSDWLLSPQRLISGVVHWAVGHVRQSRLSTMRRWLRRMWKTKMIHFLGFIRAEQWQRSPYAPLMHCWL